MFEINVVNQNTNHCLANWPVSPGHWTCGFMALQLAELYAQDINSVGYNRHVSVLWKSTGNIWRGFSVSGKIYSMVSLHGSCHINKYINSF